MTSSIYSQVRIWKIRHWGGFSPPPPHPHFLRGQHLDFFLGEDNPRHSYKLAPWALATLPPPPPPPHLKIGSAVPDYQLGKGEREPGNKIIERTL